MQNIKHSFTNIHPFFTDIERLYSYTSELDKPKALIKPTFPIEFKPYIELFNKYGACNYKVAYIPSKYDILKVDKDESKDMIIAFSGGKDSTATAVYYKQHGYNVYLYHALGLNPSYPDEWKRADEIASYLDVPLIKEKFSTEGKKDFIEHPLKNIIIVNGAIQWAIKNDKALNIAVGNYTNPNVASLNANPFYICGDDCLEMWEAYEKSLQNVLPNFKINMCLDSLESTLNILKDDMQLFEMTQSCLGPQRFRQWTHDKNESKYNIKLLKHRCGSCWKCAYEYIWLADHDLQEYNKEYYKHCLDVLVKEEKREYGYEFVDWETLWKDSFSHKSKYFEEV